MRLLFHRMAALLLVPCLLADPLTVRALRSEPTPARAGFPAELSSLPNAFTECALADRAIGMLHDLLNAVHPLTIYRLLKPVDDLQGGLHARGSTSGGGGTRVKNLGIAFLGIALLVPAVLSAQGVKSQEGALKDTVAEPSRLNTGFADEDPIKQLQVYLQEARPRLEGFEKKTIVTQRQMLEQLPVLWPEAVRLALAGNPAIESAVVNEIQIHPTVPLSKILAHTGDPGVIPALEKALRLDLEEDSDTQSAILAALEQLRNAPRIDLETALKELRDAQLIAQDLRTYGEIAELTQLSQHADHKIREGAARLLAEIARQEREINQLAHQIGIAQSSNPSVFGRLPKTYYSREAAMNAAWLLARIALLPAPDGRVRVQAVEALRSLLKQGTLEDMSLSALLLNLEKEPDESVRKATYRMILLDLRDIAPGFRETVRFAFYKHFRQELSTAGQDILDSRWWIPYNEPLLRSIERFEIYRSAFERLPPNRGNSAPLPSNFVEAQKRIRLFLWGNASMVVLQTLVGVILIGLFWPPWYRSSHPVTIRQFESLMKNLERFTAYQNLFTKFGSETLRRGNYIETPRPPTRYPLVLNALDRLGRSESGQAMVADALRDRNTTPAQRDQLLHVIHRWPYIRLFEQDSSLRAALREALVDGLFLSGIGFRRAASLLIHWPGLSKRDLQKWHLLGLLRAYQVSSRDLHIRTGIHNELRIISHGEEGSALLQEIIDDPGFESLQRSASELLQRNSWVPLEHPPEYIRASRRWYPRERQTSALRPVVLFFAILFGYGLYFPATRNSLLRSLLHLGKVRLVKVGSVEADLLLFVAFFVAVIIAGYVILTPQETFSGGGFRTSDTKPASEQSWSIAYALAAAGGVGIWLVSVALQERLGLSPYESLFLALVTMIGLARVPFLVRPRIRAPMIPWRWIRWGIAAAILAFLALTWLGALHWVGAYFVGLWHGAAGSTLVAWPAWNFLAIPRASKIWRWFVGPRIAARAKPQPKQGEDDRRIRLEFQSMPSQNSLVALLDVALSSPQNFRRVANYAVATLHHVDEHLWIEAQELLIRMLQGWPHGQAVKTVHGKAMTAVETIYVKVLTRAASTFSRKNRSLQNDFETLYGQEGVNRDTSKIQHTSRQFLFDALAYVTPEALIDLDFFVSTLISEWSKNRWSIYELDHLEILQKEIQKRLATTRSSQPPTPPSPGSSKPLWSRLPWLGKHLHPPPQQRVSINGAVQAAA